MEAAVVGYAEGVLKSSVGKLDSFLLNEALLVASVREDIIYIRDELQSMDAVLRDFIFARQLNQQNKVWMLHVLQVACDAELCNDEFTEILGGHCGHGFTGAAHRAFRFASTIISRCRIAKTIKKLKVRAKELSERRARYSTTIQTNMPDTIELTRRAHEAPRHPMRNWHLIAEDDLVGFDSETWSRVMQLASKSGVTTVIVGPAGSGKTALAKMVYRRRNDPNNGIQASAWVTLSNKRSGGSNPSLNQHDDTKRVLYDILRQVDASPGAKEMEKEELADKLRNHLGQMRFLLIFDSLWNIENWKKIQGALPQNTKGTIVATTQVMEVANALSKNEEKNIIKIGPREKQFIDQDRKDLCAKLLDLTSVTIQSRDQWVRQIVGWFTPHGLLHVLFKDLWNWFSVQIWLHLGIVMVSVMISYQVLHGLLTVVWTCFHGQHWTLIIVVLILISFQDIRIWLRRFLGEHWALSMVILVSSSFLVLWNLFQGQVWLALSKATFIVVLLLLKVIQVQLNEILHNLKGKTSYLVAWYMMVILYCTNMAPFVFLYSIICQVVSVLDDYIIAQVQRIVKHQARAKGVPLNRVHYYLRLTSSRILGVNSLVPLEVKFICGALTCQRMDSNRVYEFFKKLDQLANNENDAERLEEVTLTCYNLMSKSLKQCAQDLHRVLPECYAVKRKRITRRWIARNLARTKQGPSSEEVAESYFEELQVRGFIEPESIYPTGQTKTCRINSVFKAIDPAKLNCTEILRENQQTSSSNDTLPDPTQLETTKIVVRLFNINYPVQLNSTENSRDNLQGDLVPAQLYDHPIDPTQLNSTENSRDNLQGDLVPAQLYDHPIDPTQLHTTEDYLMEFNYSIFPPFQSNYSTADSWDNLQSADVSVQLSDIPINPTQSNSTGNPWDNQQRDDVLVQLSDITHDSTQSNFTTDSRNNLQEDDVTKNSGENEKRFSFQLFDIPPSSVRERLRKDLELEYSKSLTVLDLEGCKYLNSTELSLLCRFVELRFLSLRNINIEKVPPNIGKLKQLETLDIRQTQIEKVPKDILRLKHLKRLLAGYFYKPESATTDDLDRPRVRSIELPAGMEEMKNLETLAYVNATRTSNLLISLQELTQLKKLSLVIREGNLNSRPLCISLMMLSDSLRSLSVCDERERVNSLDFLEYLCFPPLNLNSLTLSGYLGRLPQWVSNHKLLSKLTLANTHLRSNAIRLIGKIPTLLCLKLYRRSYDDDNLNLKMNEFTVLKVLIIHCDAIDMIRFEKGSTTKLEVFRWVFPKAQIGRVSGIENLPMLKEVSLIGAIDADLEKDIKRAVIEHSSSNTTLVFEKIEKKTPESNAQVSW